MSLGPVIQEEPFTSIQHYPTHYRTLPVTTAPVNFTNPFVTSSASILEPSVPAYQDVPRTTDALSGHSRRYSGSGSYQPIAYPTVSLPASSRHMSSPALFTQPELSHMNDHTSYRSEQPTSTSSGTSPTNTSFAPQVSAYQHFLSVPYNQNRSYQVGGDRRLSQPSLPSQGFGSPIPPRPRQLSMYNWPATSGTTQSYYATSVPTELSEEMEASRGMLAMASQNGMRVSRGSHDSAYYTSGGHHSAASSISNSSGYMPEYGSTADLSSPEYHDMSRSLPQPSSYIGSTGEDARSMMHRFNSRPPSNSKKNHVCRICGKTFARPSSLTTHTYSHTGQKPFKCEQEGCGKKFNVVSNLRRHYKVHKTKK
jgi:hypothetical protein